MNQIKYVLVVDDNDNDLAMTQMALIKQNVVLQTAVAHDGAEALDYLYRRGQFMGRESSQPHVVLLDLKMPLVDGLEVLRQMKSDPELKTIPVVMLTSSSEEKDVIKSYQLGANAYVVKPVDFQKFLKVINEVSVFWTTINEPPPQPTDRASSPERRSTQQPAMRSSGTSEPLQNALEVLQQSLAATG
jgi:CheY-like chemotaxis protein